MRRLFRALRALACFGCLLAFATVAWAQAAGQLTGVVRDNTGGVLPGASLTISGTALLTPRTVVTDELGTYEIEKLSRGRYSVTAALRGFQPSTIDLDVDGGSTTLDVVLLAIDAGLDRVVLRALERDPARRYQHASELKTDVTSVSSEEAIPTPAAPAAPVLTVPFWALTSLITNSTSTGFVELYDDRVAFDFEVVSTWGPRSLRAVHIPLDRVRSVEFTHSWLKGKFVQMRVEHGPWMVQLPFTWEGTVWFAVGSKEEGEGFVAAMRERLGKVTSPCL